MNLGRTFLVCALWSALPLSLSASGCSSDSGGDGHDHSAGDSTAADTLDGGSTNARLDGSATSLTRGDGATVLAADGAVISAPARDDSGTTATTGTGDEADASAASGDAGHEAADAGTVGATSCGARKGDVCSATEYCSYTLADQCGAADQGGACKPRPKVCPDVVTAEGFCGCDGKNYGNECFAERAGTSVLHVGMCSGATTPPAGGAAEGKMCAGIAGIQCASGLFCDLEQGQGCPKNLADGAGKCTAIPAVCTKENTPVCGCDGKTYSNPCEAHSAGASVMHTGACK